jgi:hypothetical protein
MIFTKILTIEQGVMGRAQLPASIERLQFTQPLLWSVAIVFFGIGDMVTTGFGLSMNAVHEAGPVTSVFLEQYGLLSMVAVKLAVFGGFYFVWRLTPRRYQIGVPLGLVIVGVVVVWWNLFVNLLVRL